MTDERGNNVFDIKSGDNYLFVVLSQTDITELVFTCVIDCIFKPHQLLLAVMWKRMALLPC